MNNWSAQIKKYAEKGKQDLSRVCKAVKIELFSETLSLTRVDTGRLRGNWQIQENVKPSGDLQRLDPQGTAVQAEIEAKASPDGVTYFVNNLPYAKKYEEIDAMVGRSVARVRQTVDRLAKE